MACRVWIQCSTLKPMFELEMPSFGAAAADAVDVEEGADVDAEPSPLPRLQGRAEGRQGGYSGRLLS